jgi:hypothetical protein
MVMFTIRPRSMSDNCCRMIYSFGLERWLNAAFLYADNQRVGKGLNNGKK